MPIRESITIEDALEVLNRAVKADSVAMKTLIGARVDCNQAFADDETIQVQGMSFMPTTNREKPKYHQVGFLGVLNGLFGIADDGWGAIAANFDVECDRGCKVPNGKKVGEKCETCGDTLRLGKLTHFSRVR